MNKAIAIVGGQGTGKTTLISNLIKNVNKKALFIYDVNNEYKELIGYDWEYQNFEDFLHEMTKIRKACIVFEEATIFFSNKSSNKEITNLLVRKRHTKNTIFLVFHSLSSMPSNIITLVDSIIVFKTRDAINKVDQKFDEEELTQLFERVKNHSDKHYKEIFSCI